MGVLLCAPKSDLFKYILMCIYLWVYYYVFYYGYLNILTLFFYKCVWLKPNNK